MYYETKAELFVRVPIYVEADSQEEADAIQEKYIKSKKFRDYCKKQITANDRSDCVVAVYNDHCTVPVSDDKVITYKIMSDWPFI